MRNESSLKQLFSSLEPASLKELDEQMLSDEKLAETLTTEGKDLPKNYGYLLGEVVDDWDKKTLYDFISTTLNYHRPNTTLHSFFSKSDGKIVGFAAYEVDSSLRFRDYPFVSEIKMFSFDLKKLNSVLLRDLRGLLDKLLEEYPEVTWVAVKDNPANKIYKRVLDLYGGKVNSIDGGRLLEYCVYQKKEE